MAITKKANTVIYFLVEANLTEDDKAIAEQITERVYFINGSYVNPEDLVDVKNCGYVGIAGPAIPANWLEAFGKAIDTEIRNSYFENKVKSTFK
jgi:hypothetical protein